MVGFSNNKTKSVTDAKSIEIRHTEKLNSPKNFIYYTSTYIFYSEHQNSLFFPDFGGIWVGVTDWPFDGGPSDAIQTPRIRIDSGVRRRVDNLKTVLLQQKVLLGDETSRERYITTHATLRNNWVTERFNGCFALPKLRDTAWNLEAAVRGSQQCMLWIIASVPSVTMRRNGFAMGVFVRRRQLGNERVKPVGSNDPRNGDRLGCPSTRIEGKD
ncbi:hypothetical protein R3P38DRAFT_2786410 [Favolaschia claudopus]|uniref:Uncharacterized protein n=1 Tax=Favolaschia claudopus TaxID=2862362 RepID=A0AAW0ATS7_9AGAR